MEAIFAEIGPGLLVLAAAIAVLAGLVKGLVGFAMPMILIAGLSSFLAPDLALAGLILPTLVTNGMQALGQGAAAAWGSVKRFRVFMGVGLLCLLASAQVAVLVTPEVFYLMLGVPVVIFAALQLAGLRWRLEGPSARAEAGVGAVAGFIGGFSGVWGPPTVLYLTAIDTPKEDQMRVQGVIYGLGAVALTGAHLGSGVLRAETWPFSVLLVGPAVLGMWAGARLRHRVDQGTFRRITLLVLVLAGANLVRRGLMG